jgi:putative membrane protein
MPELQWLTTAFPNFVRNSAAATALVGALLGFCLPLANTIAHSVSLTDVVLWSLVALAVQLIVHLGMRLMLPHLREAIEANQAAAGITAGGFAVCFGLVNAACLTT